jgi:hypothetical protein
MVMGMPSTSALLMSASLGAALAGEAAASCTRRPAITSTLRAAMTEAMRRWPMSSAREKGRAMVKAKADMSAPRLRAKKQMNALAEESQAEVMTGMMMSATSMRKQTLAPKQDRRLTNMASFFARWPSSTPTTCSYLGGAEYEQMKPRVGSEKEGGGART